VTALRKNRIRRRAMLRPLLKQSIRLVLAGLAMTLWVAASGQRQEFRSFLRPAGMATARSASVAAALPQEPVSVKARTGRPVPDLGPADFRIEEEGAPQRLGYFGKPGATPVEVALLLDVSASITEHFDLEKQAAAVFVREVINGGSAVSVISIGTQPRLVLDRTESLETALAAIRSLQHTRETTAFFDAIVAGAHQLRRSSTATARRAVVAISDGEDTASRKHSLSDALGELQRADSLFYSINPSGASVLLNIPAKKGQEGMSTLASETGGAFLSSSPREVHLALANVAADLKGQYLLGYYSSPDARDGHFRRISVMLPLRTDLQVQARRGYYSDQAIAAP
jgi:Ca-activated chloride channel family protein